MRPLLLHFEETTSDTDAKVGSRQSEIQMTGIQRIAAGTRTLSEVRAEANDTDIQGIVAGTSTCTRVLAEGNDTDPHVQNRNGLAIPI